MNQGDDKKFVADILKSLIPTIGLLDQNILQEMVNEDKESFRNIDNGSLAIINPTYYRKLMQSGELDHLKTQQAILAKFLEIRILLNDLDDAAKQVREYESLWDND